MTIKITAVVSILAVGIVLGALPCHAENLCKTRGRTLKVREDTCRKSESLLDAASAGLQGPVGPGGPGAIVKDANDALVGTYTVIEDFTFGFSKLTFGIVRAVGSSVAALNLTDQTTLVGTSPLAYTSSDCSGAPSIFKPGTSAILISPSFVDGGTMYYANGSYSIQGFNSYRFPNSSGCNVQMGSSAELAPTATADLSGLVPPFHVELTQ